MEELGGGGHLSNAATQIADVTVSEAVDMLKSVIIEKDEEDE
jgi:c-di-AMP phosphodiesterase-like protein